MVDKKMGGKRIVKRGGGRVNAEARGNGKRVAGRCSNFEWIGGRVEGW